jgi:3-methyladenine DNA glycosylase Tag
VSYCIIARDHPLHGPYHIGEYGFPIEDENALFERLMLEINKTFVFTGGEITGSFLISIGYLPGGHDENCAVYRKIAKLRPKWATKRLNEPKFEVRSKN